MNLYIQLPFFIRFSFESLINLFPFYITPQNVFIFENVNQTWEAMAPWSSTSTNQGT